MHIYQKQTVINQDIDSIFTFLDGSEANLQIIDPNIISSVAKNLKTEVIGSTYLQKYKIKSKVIHLHIQVNEYQNDADCKAYGINFVVKEMLEINMKYTLKQIDEQQTQIDYQIINKPLNRKAKMMLKLTSKSFGNEIVNTHLQNIENHFNQ